MQPQLAPPLPWQSPGAQTQPPQQQQQGDLEAEPELPELPLNDTLDTLRKLEMLYKPARNRHQLQQQTDSSDEVRRLRIPSSKFMPQPVPGTDYDVPEFSSSSGSESEGEEEVDESGAESGGEETTAPPTAEVASHDTTSPESGVDTKTPASGTEEKPPSSVEEAKSSPESSTAHKHNHKHSGMSIRFPGLPCEEDCQCCQNESLPDLLRKLQESVDITTSAPDDLSFLDVDLTALL